MKARFARLAACGIKVSRCDGTSPGPRCARTGLQTGRPYGAGKVVTIGSRLRRERIMRGRGAPAPAGEGAGAPEIIERVIDFACTAGGGWATHLKIRVADGAR